MTPNEKLIIQLRFYQAVVDVVRTFGEMEIGECEVDEEAVANYVASFKFVNDLWGISSKEDIYQKLTDDIINGWPVWDFLKLSDWKRNMLDREFRRKAEEERARLEQEYKCYTCKWLEEKETSLGIFRKCKKPRDGFEMKRREYFDPKKRCKAYEPKDV